MLGVGPWPRRVAHAQPLGLSSVSQVAFGPLRAPSSSSSVGPPHRKRLAVASREQILVYRAIEGDGARLQHLALEARHVIETEETLTALAFYEGASSRYVVGAVVREWPVIRNAALQESAADDFRVDTRMDATVRIWDAEADMETVKELRSPGLGEVTYLVVSAARLYAVDVLGNCHVWDKTSPETSGFASKSLMRPLHKGRVVGAETDAFFAYTAGADLRIGIWREKDLDTACGKGALEAAPATREFRIAGLGPLVRPSSRWGLCQVTRGRGAVKPQGFLFAAAWSEESQGIVMKWDLGQHRCVQCVRGHCGHITAMVFGPYDNGPLITAGEDGCVRLWEASAMACLGCAGEHSISISGVCVDPQHHVYSCGSDGTLKVWSLACVGEEAKDSTAAAA